MTTIRFACQCGKAIAVPASAAGRRGKCAGCGRPLVVPGAAPGLTTGVKPQPPRSTASSPAPRRAEPSGARPGPPQPILPPRPSKDELELAPPPPARRVEPAGIVGMAPAVEEEQRAGEPASRLAYPSSALDYRAPIRVRKPQAPRFFLSFRLIILLMVLFVGVGFALYRYLVYTPALGELVVLEQFGVSFRPPANWKTLDTKYDKCYLRHPDLKGECMFMAKAVSPGQQSDLEKEIAEFEAAPGKLGDRFQGTQVKDKELPKRYKLGSFDAVEVAMKVYVPTAYESQWLYYVAIDIGADLRVFLLFSHITSIGSGALRRLKDQVVQSIAKADVKIEPGNLFESKYFDYSLRIPAGFEKKEESPYMSGHLVIFDQPSQEELGRRIRIVAYPTDTSAFDLLLKAYRIRTEVELGRDGAVGSDLKMLQIAGSPAARFGYTVKGSEGITYLVQRSAHCIIDISVRIENAPRQYRDAVADLLTSTLAFKSISTPPMGGRIEFEKPAFSLCVPQGWNADPAEKPGKTLLATYGQADPKIELRVYGYSLTDEDIDEDEGLNLREFAELHMPKDVKQGTVGAIDLKETKRGDWPVFKVFYVSLDSEHLLDTFVKLGKDKVLLLRMRGFGYHEKFDCLTDAILATVQTK